MALQQHAGREARERIERGPARLDLHVNQDNARAIGFYASLTTTGGSP